MPEYPTSAPAAGWYTDPGNPQQERWWGGVEWTHDVRPLQAAAVTAPAPPALANVPGGGLNPFAVPETTQPAPSGGGPGSPFSTPASDFSGFGSFDTGAAQGTSNVSPSWYDSSRSAAPQPDPTNGFATAGLVLSLIGANLLGIIFSMLGLRKARELEGYGDLPVGRKRSRWGLGLGIASLIISLVLVAVYVFAAQYLLALYNQQTSSGVVQTEEPGGIVLNPVTPGADESNAANDGTYVRADYEQAIRDEYAEDGYPAPDSVVCPDAGSTSAGSTIVCTIVTGDVTETRTADYYENGGYSISTTSFSG